MPSSYSISSISNAAGMVSISIVARIEPAGQAEHLLGVVEHQRPQPGLEVALHLRQVEVRAAAAVELLARVVEQVEARRRRGRRRVGSPSTSRCRSGRCQPRGRGTIVGSSPSSRSRYSLPSGLVNDSVRRTASLSTTCPPTTLRQCGVLASSRSASQTFAPQLSALIAIFGSVGPVISTRRSTSPGGGGGTCQPPARTCAVSGAEVDPAGGGDLRPAGGAGGQQRVAVGAEPGLQVGDERQRLRRQDLLAPLDRRALHAHVRHRGPPSTGWSWHPLTVAALDDFNDEPADQAVQALRACNAAPRFAAEVVAGRPYRDVETLVARAEEVARALPWDDVADRAGRAPADRRPGRRAPRPRRESSRREQSSMADADADTRDALRRGQPRLRGALRPRLPDPRRPAARPEEMLAELRRRLDNDEEAERAEVTEQLAQITALRVRGLVS